MRKVRGLIEVGEVADPGNRRGGSRDFAPAAGEGLRYEHALALHAASYGWRIKHGQWFKYRDAKGVAYCQPDVLALPPEKDRIILLEAKLTQKEEGVIKLKKVYVPVVRHIYRLPVFPILCFKNIVRETELMLRSLEEALALPHREAEKVYSLHWSAL